jgi:amino acid permease
MSFTFLYHAASYISIVAGLCFLSISIFMPNWFGKGGILHKKYSGDDGRVIYALIGIFFIIGGLTLLLSQ